jgi:hypothetical protein
VFSLFGRGGKGVVPPRLGSRRAASTAPVNRVNLDELTPDILHFLGQAAYIQLCTFETLSRAVVIAPTTQAKETISRVAALSLAKHHGLIAEIVKRGADAGDVMQPFTTATDEFGRVTLGNDWYEILVTSYITAGILDDFFVRLAAGLPDGYPERITALLSGDDGGKLIVGMLRDAIDANPHLASRLALWGRRLVGDTLLVARSALPLGDRGADDDEKLEPVFTELIAAHTRRMDGLGLTA